MISIQKKRASAYHQILHPARLRTARHATAAVDAAIPDMPGERNTAPTSTGKPITFVLGSSRWRIDSNGRNPPIAKSGLIVYKPFVSPGAARDFGNLVTSL